MNFLSKPEKVKVLHAPFPCVVELVGEGRFDLEVGDALVVFPNGYVGQYTLEEFARAFHPEKKVQAAVHVHTSDLSTPPTCPHLLASTVARPHWRTTSTDDVQILCIARYFYGLLWV